MNDTYSPLFERIMTCSKAIRYIKEKNKNYVSSYEEVMQRLPQSNGTVHGHTDVVNASLEYLKVWFVQRGTDDRKGKIAMNVSLLIAYDQDKTVLAKEVCQYFRGIDDFYRPMMLKIFNFSISNDRVRALLDKTKTMKTKDTLPAIEREFNVEFVFLFFSVMESLVFRGHTLTNLGYAAKVTPSDMEGAREIINQHVEDIATKCSPCFKKEVLKPPREQSNLFPAGGALPHVSIGCVPVNYDNVLHTNDELEKRLQELQKKANTTDELQKGLQELRKQELQNKLQESLIDKKEKGEFLGIMFAAISYASNDDPVATLRGIKLDSVKEFFMKKILDEAQEEKTRQAILASDEARELRQEVVSLKEENSSLKEELSSVKEEALSQKKYWEEIGEKYEKLVFDFNPIERELEEKKEELPRVKLELAYYEKQVEHLNNFYGNKMKMVNKKPKISQKEKNNEMWHKSKPENNWSGDEDEE